MAVGSMSWWTRARGRSWRAAVGGAGAAVLLSGCFWSQPGFGPEHRRHNPNEDALTIDNVDTLGEQWSVELDRPDVGGTTSEAIVADGRVYVSRAIAATDGGIYAHAFDADTGASLWDREMLSGHAVLTWPFPNARSGDSLSAGYRGLVGGQCAGGYGRLDPADGSGTIVTAGAEHRSPAVTSGSMAVQVAVPTVVAPTGACTFPSTIVEGRDVRTGVVRWRATLGPTRTWQTAFMPAIGGNRVFVPQASTLHSFPLAGCGAATCAPTWSVDLGGDIATVAPPVVTPSGQVVTITDQGEMIAVSAATGDEQWRAHLGWTMPTFGLGRRPGVAVAGDVLYASAPGTASGSVLRAFPAGGCGAPTCAPLWTATTPEAVTAPAVAGGVVYVGAAGAVHAYDAAGCGSPTCSPLVSVPFGGWVEHVSVANGRIYAVGAARVSALAPASG